MLNALSDELKKLVASSYRLANDTSRILPRQRQSLYFCTHETGDSDGQTRPVGYSMARHAVWDRDVDPLALM